MSLALAIIAATNTGGYSGGTTPAAPTSGVVDDVADTFNWTNNPLFTSLSDYEYTLNGGSSYSTVTAKPIVVGNVVKAIGQVGVRVKSMGGNPASSTLYNSSAFTLDVDYSPTPFSGSVNTELINLTEGETPAYRGWPASYAVQDKRAFLYREGSTHLFSSGSKMILRVTDDGGFTWSRTELHSESGIDTRNYGGGNSSDGRIVIFYGRWGNSGANWISIRAVRSFDGGATWTHSSDLPLYSLATDNFSPYGPMIENDAGTLWKQAFYGSNSDEVPFWYVWTLESSDLINWGSPKLIASGSLTECHLEHLGAGKVIAAIRKDNSPSDKDVEIYNSDDFGETWTLIDKAQFDGADIAGASPYLEKIDGDNFNIIGTWRGSVNNFSESQLAFGGSDATGLTRFMHPGLPNMDTNNIDFGYPAKLDFKLALDDNRLIAFYGTSPNWVSGTPHYTDMFVGPAYRKQLTITTSSRNVATGSAGDVHFPNAYLSDEIPVYEAGISGYQQKIRENANYDIRVEATFTGGITTGTYRKIEVHKYDNAGAFVSVLHSENQANTNNVFDFTYNAALVANDRVVIALFQDSGSTITVTSKCTITKVLI